MTPDDFKQKCDEIHRIVCYLLNDNDIPKVEFVENMWIGNHKLKCLYAENETCLVCAIYFCDAHNITKHWEIPFDVVRLESIP